MARQIEGSQARPDDLPEGAQVNPLTGRAPFGYNPATPVGPHGTGGENPALLEGAITDAEGRLTAPAGAQLKG